MSGNAQSLRNKLDGLNACTNHLHEYRESNVICFSETWFSDRDSQQDSHIDGFTCERSDRTANSAKESGGGVCIYVNNRWCKNISVKQKLCTPDIEQLTVAVRPFYLPREFNHIFITIVYIHPRADMKAASNIIHDIYQGLETHSPDAVKLIIGDFNSCELKNILLHYYQYVDIPTRGERILDKCYGNIRNGYKAIKIKSRSV